MKKIKILLVLTLMSLNLFAQKENANEILKEGKLLYRLEKASWYATDHLWENFRDKTDSMGGYLSYISDNNSVCTIFWNKYDSTHLLIKYFFDSLPKPEPLSYVTGGFTNSKENELIAIRIDAKNQVINDQEGFFSFYPNSSYNFIPLISGNERKVFIITGPTKGNNVLLGNDYLLVYNKENKFLRKSKIHNSLIKLPYKGKDKNNIIKETIHSHVVTELISSTDICTLLLYKEFVEWNIHYVIGKKYVSIFIMENETLTTMKTKAFFKMYKNEEP